MSFGQRGPYVDLQVNGFMGIDFNDPATSVADIARAAELMKADGVETALPTVITGPLGDMSRCLANIRDAVDEFPIAREVFVGIHVEGPFISSVKGYVGAHPVDAVRVDDLEALERLLAAGGGLVKLMTLAPEADPHCRLIRRLVQDRILVAAGHTDASVDQLQRAIDAGLQLFTHIGNACPQMMHRHDNIIHRALSLAAQLKYTFIADGWHLPSFVVKNLLQLVGIERLSVVSDAICAAGLGPGEFQLGARKIRVGTDKCARSPDGEHFVGAASTMHDNDLWLTEKVSLTAQQRHMLLYENPRSWLQAAL